MPYKRHAGRICYLPFKDVDPRVKYRVKSRVTKERIGFYDACARGLFCTLGQGSVDFAGLREAMIAEGFQGWAIVAQDCDPAGATSPADDARANLAYLREVGLAR